MYGLSRLAAAVVASAIGIAVATYGPDRGVDNDVGGRCSQPLRVVEDCAPADLVVCGRALEMGPICRSDHRCPDGCEPDDTTSSPFTGE